MGFKADQIELNRELVNLKIGQKQIRNEAWRDKRMENKDERIKDIEKKQQNEHKCIPESQREMWDRSHI